MAKIRYCWRCRIDVPLLEEAEWLEIEPLLRADYKATQQIRAEKGLGLREALADLQSRACERLRELTGFTEQNFNAIWHHRLAEFGPECQMCGHLLRTPRASYCAQCGTPRDAAHDAAVALPDARTDADANR